MPPEHAGAKLGKNGQLESTENTKKKTPPKIPSKIPSKSNPPPKLKPKPKPKPKQNLKNQTKPEKKPVIKDDIKQRKITELFRTKENKLVKKDDVKTCKPSTSKEQEENKTEDGYSSVNKVSTTIAAEPDLDEVEFVKNNIFPSRPKPAQIRK